MNATQYETLISDTFAYIVSEGLHPRLPAGQQTAPDRPGQRFLSYVDVDGNTVHAYAYGPFAFEDADGKVREFDTTLLAAQSGFRPASAPYSVTIPSRFADGIVWQDFGEAETVRLVPRAVRGQSAAGRMFPGTTDKVIYEDAWAGTHVVVGLTADGIKDHIIVTDSSSGTAYTFRIDRPGNATTLITADGGVNVVSGAGRVLARLPKPAGRDRDHQEFRVWYEIAPRGGYDDLELHYDPSPVTGEGVTVTYEAPFDLDPAIFARVPQLFAVLGMRLIRNACISMGGLGAKLELA